MLDFCLLHYLLTAESEAMTHQKCHHSIHYFSELLTKKIKLVLYWIILRVSNTPRFGSAIQVLPSDTGEYLSSFFNAVVAVVFYFYFYVAIEKSFFLIVILLSGRKFIYFIYEKKNKCYKSCSFYLIMFFDIFLLFS